METTPNDIEVRALAKFVGTIGLPCPRCKSPLAYVNEMGGISCRDCHRPKLKHHVRAILVLIKVDGRNIWHDGRAERDIAKWSVQTGIDPQILRDAKVTIESIRDEVDGFNQVWPPAIA